MALLEKDYNNVRLLVKVIEQCEAVVVKYSEC